MLDKLKNIFRGDPEKTIELGAYVSGEVVKLSEVNDPTFAEEMLGTGVAMLPSSGTLYSPIDAEVTLVFDTMHAVTLETENHVEILLHIGLDTVQLSGEGYQAFVKAGDKVKKGDPLLGFDMELIKRKGYDLITPMIICNTEEFKSITPVEGAHEVGDTVLKIKLD